MPESSKYRPSSFPVKSCFHAFLHHHCLSMRMVLFTCDVSPLSYAGLVPRLTHLYNAVVGVCVCGGGGGGRGVQLKI